MAFGAFRVLGMRPIPGWTEVHCYRLEALLFHVSPTQFCQSNTSPNESDLIFNVIFILISHLTKQCVACNTEIPPDVVRLTFDNLNWHLSPDCFNCYACQKDLLDTHFLIKKNLLFCSVQCKRKVLLPKKKHLAN